MAIPLTATHADTFKIDPNRSAGPLTGSNRFRRPPWEGWDDSWMGGRDGSLTMDGLAGDHAFGLHPFPPGATDSYHFTGRIEQSNAIRARDGPKSNLAALPEPIDLRLIKGVERQRRK
jgi:hypothetical protein